MPASSLTGETLLDRWSGRLCTDFPSKIAELTTIGYADDLFKKAFTKTADFGEMKSKVDKLEHALGKSTTPFGYQQNILTRSLHCHFSAEKVPTCSFEN